jgi:uncharacterized protein (DUF427 family)
MILYNRETGEQMKAEWKGTIIAQSDQTVVIEGNHYFPPDSVRNEYLQPSSKTTVCPWKGTASFYNVVVDGSENPDAAWYYPTPKDAASEIKDHVAFWRGVDVVNDTTEEANAGRPGNSL